LEGDSEATTATKKGDTVTVVQNSKEPQPDHEQPVDDEEGTDAMNQSNGVDTDIDAVNKSKPNQMAIINGGGGGGKLNHFTYDNIEASFSLENLVYELENCLSKGHYKEKHIWNHCQMLMNHYDAEPEDYQKYAIKLDENQYTRNLIKDSPYFTLMLICWPPAICSPIHDHGGSECWLRVCSGSLEERFYNLPEHEDAEITMRFAQTHADGEVCFINDEQGLHSIRNPTNNQWAVSLHCYVPGYVSCNAFLDEKCASKGKKNCKLSFTTVDGVMVE